MHSAPTKNKKVLSLVDDIAKLAEPAQIHWCDGSKKEFDALCTLLVEKGTFIKLNEKKRPGSFLARSRPEDAARADDRSYICTEREIDAGPTNKWANPKEMHTKLNSLFKGCMKGRTMYVSAFSLCDPAAPFARFGLQISDSPYVMTHLYLMAHTGKKVWDALDSERTFVPCIHSVGMPLTDGREDSSWPCDPDNIYVCLFTETHEIWSYGSNYGENAILSRLFALRLGSVLGRDEDWLAEHMLVVGLETPEKQTTYIAGAFPNGCGKTNLSMLPVPKSFKGYKVKTVCEDAAWLFKGQDGRLYASNPETGIFSLLPSKSNKNNPNIMEMCKKNTIFTNAALTDDGDIWWGGLTETPPSHLVDWQGKDWSPTDAREPAHSNARFCTSIENCPTLDTTYDPLAGVPISALLFGGRMSKNTPLIYEALSFTHGVFLASSIGSEKYVRGPLEEGTPEITYDPMAIKPFCGYNIGDYFSHWLNFGRKLASPPPVFRVNFFRRDADGDFLWPGYGENIRLLKWVSDRANGKLRAIESPVGLMPLYEDIETDGITFSKSDYKKMMAIERSVGVKEINELQNQMRPLADMQRLPKEFIHELGLLLLRLERSGDVWEPM